MFLTTHQFDLMKKTTLIFLASAWILHYMNRNLFSSAILFSAGMILLTESIKDFRKLRKKYGK